MFHRVFVANRGEVAARVARTCDRLGITPVFALSEADRHGPWAAGRESVVLGPARAAGSYLDPVRVVQAAVQTRCSALHPGWGFLSENPLLAALCASHGVTFLGPPPQAMQLMGRKTPAKRAARAAGLSLIPGSDGVLADVEAARAVAAEVGYPVLLKAESGGGGRGMRVARSEAELARAFEDASSEAGAAFGDARLYLERLIEGGRHVEIQILADRYGHAIHLGERDCTVQRSHQKLIEESPAPGLPADERDRAAAAAVRLARQIGYVGAGTIEFLLDGPAVSGEGAPAKTGGGTLRFMEMNTRLQVEHPVSEMRSGLDLVEWQLRVAAGQRLTLQQADVVLAGHAIECRINAEDPAEGFRPAPGTISRFVAPPASDGVRVDTHVAAGYVVPPHYDSLICKVIVHAADRPAAIERMLAALGELVLDGVPTTVPMHLAILRSAAFRSGDYDTRAVPGWPPRA
jgi:acetyl-CoA carboxylase biotin carboxylase subunit